MLTNHRLLIHRAESISQKWYGSRAVRHDPADIGEFSKRAIPEQICNRPRGIQHEFHHAGGISIGRHIPCLVSQEMDEDNRLAAVEISVQIVLVVVAKMTVDCVAKLADAFVLQDLKRQHRFVSSFLNRWKRQQRKSSEPLRMVRYQLRQAFVTLTRHTHSDIDVAEVGPRRSN